MATSLFNSSIRKGLFLALCMMASVVSVWAQEGGDPTPTYVAQIGEQGYASLADALTAASSATEESPVTINLIDNISLTDVVTIPAHVTLDVANEKTISITLNGHNISLADGGAFINAGTLTIIDSGSSAVTVDAITNNRSLTVDGGVIVNAVTSATGTPSISLLNNAAVPKLTVTSGITATISGSGYTNLAGEGTVKLGGDISNNLTIASGNNLTIDLCGHNLTGSISNAGTLTLNDNPAAEASEGSITTLTNSGTLTVNSTVTTLTNINGTVTISERKTVNSLTSNSGTVTANGAVTSFVTTGETTISGGGISSISGSGTIKLGDAITQNLTITSSEGQTMTLDLNGKGAGTVTNAGKILVTDSSASAGSITELTSNANTEVTINSGTITTLNANNASTSVIINGGIVTTLNTGESTTVKFTGINSKTALETAIGLTSKSTIELGGDIDGGISITEGKNIALDLKGNNISGTLNNAGTLVLNDAGKVSDDPATTVYGTITTLNNTGTLTANQGNVTTLTATAGTTEIKGGTIGDASASGTGNILTVSGGSITGTLTTAADNIVTVEDGTVNAFSGEYVISFPKVNSEEKLTQALKALKPDVKLTGNIEANSETGFRVGANSLVSIDVNGQTITNTPGNTFEVPEDGALTLTGSGSVNGADSKVAVNNSGTFTLNGPAVASATLNGTQMVSGGTLTTATLSSSKNLTISGGTVTTLNAEGTNTVTTTGAGAVTTLKAAGEVSVSGDGFKQFAGPTDTEATITLTTNLSSNLTITEGKVNLALDGKTISNKESQNTLTVNEGATLTVSGTGSITNNSDANAAIDNNGTTTLSGGTITSAKSTAGTLTISTGSTVTTLTAGEGTASINGGNVTNLNGTGTVTLGADTESNLTVTGESVTLDLNGHNLNSAIGDDQKTVTVNNGAALTVSGSSGSVGKIVNAGTTTVQSGTVTDLSSSAGAVSFSGGVVTTLTATGGNVTINESGVVTLNAKSGSTVIIDEDGHKPTNLNAEAGATVTIGSETLNFADIKTADELTMALAINTSGSLKLAADITGDFNVPTGSDITIDLNGHNITATSGSALTLAGAATIKGNGTVGKVSVSATSGNLTLEGSTITTLDNAGTTTIKSGAVTTVSSSGTLDIQGGTVGTATATGTTTVSAGIITTLNTSEGTTTISNAAAVTTLNATGSSNVSISGGNVTTATVGKSMSVSGGEIGTLTTTTDTTGDDGGLTISDGHITTSLTVVENSKAAISGGTIEALEVGNATLTVEDGVTVNAYSGDGGANVNLPHYNITDENPGSYPKNFVATTATYTRTTGISTDNMWGTLCLPFSYTSISGNDIRLYEVSDITDNQLNLNEIALNTVIPAGTPFVFHIESSIINTFTSLNATVKTDADGSQQGTGIKLVGVNTEKVITGETTPAVTNCYFISENTFHQAKAKLTVPKYRAYLEITSSPSGAPIRNLPSLLTIAIENSATALDALFSEDGEIEGYYDMNGNLYDKPQKGMNIVKMSNGKSMKLMIK